MAHDAYGAERVAGVIPLPPQLPIAPAQFVGRTSLLTTIARTISRVEAAGDHRLVLIAGDAGMGKSSLIARAARTAFDNGCVVLYGRCDEDLGIPYRPFREALAHYIRHEDPARLARTDPTLLVALARIVAGVPRTAGEDAKPEPDSDAEQWIAFNAVSSLLAAVAHACPILLLLDDLHSADPPTIRLLKHLATSDLGGVTIIATYRETELGSSGALADAVALLRRQKGTEFLRLDGLGALDIRALLESTLGNAVPEDDPLAFSLHFDTAGNPFYVTELIRHFGASGSLLQGPAAQAPLGRGPLHDLPESVRDVIGLRIADLGDRATERLSAAAVMGLEFDVGLLSRVIGEREAVVIDFIEDAARNGLLEEVEDVFDCFAFAHALIQQALYSGLSGEQRARLHLRIGLELQASLGIEVGERAGELARHFLASSGLADPIVTARSCARAAEYATASLAPDEAVRWYQTALDLLEGDTTADAERTRLIVRLGDAQKMAGMPAFRETLLEGGRLAQLQGDPDSLVLSALSNNRGYQSASGTVDIERIEILQAALETIGPEPSPTRARLLAHLALEQTWSPDYGHVRALADEAVAMARSSGDDGALLDVLVRSAGACPDVTEATQLIADMDEAIALAPKVGDPTGAFWAARIGVGMALGIAEPDTMRHFLAVLHDEADRVALPTLRWVSTYYRSWSMLLAGDLLQAESLAREAFKLGEESGQPDNQVQYGGQMGAIRWQQGRLHLTPDMALALIAQMPDFAMLRSYVVRVLAESGWQEEADALFGSEAAVDFSVLPRVRSTYLADMAGAAYALGSAERAAQIFPHLIPYRSMIGYSGSTVEGALAHHLGTLSGLMGRVEESETYFAEALQLHERLRAPFFIARTRLEWGRMLLQPSSVQNLTRAEEHIRQAQGIAHEHGYDGIATSAAALMHQV